MNLNPEDLKVTSFPTQESENMISTGGENSWPAVCTCIGICRPTEDIYCSGGCPPEFTVPVKYDAQVR